MDIELYPQQTAHVFLTIDSAFSDFDIYGGTSKCRFAIKDNLVEVPSKSVQGCTYPQYDIFARRKSTGQEWRILDGKIIIKKRQSYADQQSLSPKQYYATIQISETVEETTGANIIVGIKGERGEKGEKGDKGEPGNISGLTIDDKPTQGSTNAVTSGGTYDAINSHTGNETAHITAEERSAWKSKASESLNNITEAGKETAVEWGLPDYSAAINVVTLGKLGNYIYTAPANGYCSINMYTWGGAPSSVYVDGAQISHAVGYNSETVSSIFIAVKKGQIVNIKSGSNDAKSSLFFIPMKGV